MRRLWLLPLPLIFVASDLLAQSVDLRAVGDAAYIAGYAIYGTPPPDWVKDRLKDFAVLKSPDLNFLNLEANLTRGCKRFFPKDFQFAVAPEALAAFAKEGFNLVSLANNHGQDCVDPDSALEIDKALAAARAQAPDFVAHGISANVDRLAREPAIFEKNGVRIGMIAIKGWEGGKRANIGNTDNRIELFTALRDAKVDIRILSVHGGTESSRRPHEVIMSLAREFVGKYGGDLVLAHHPHVMQGFELLEKADGRVAAVFYSLGNFLHNGLSDRGDGMLARVRLTREGLDPNAVEAFPLARANTRPGPITPAELPGALAVLKTSSAVALARKLPAGLKQVPFQLLRIEAPAPGLRLLVTPSKP